MQTNPRLSIFDSCQEFLPRK